MPKQRPRVCSDPKFPIGVDAATSPHVSEVVIIALGSMTHSVDVNQHSVELKAVGTQHPYIYEVTGPPIPNSLPRACDTEKLDPSQIEVV